MRAATRRSIVIAVLVSAMGPAACRNPPGGATADRAVPTADPGPDLSAGLRAFGLLRMAQARDAFAGAVRAHPDSALAHAYLGLAMNSSGNAHDEIAAAVRLAADDPPVGKARVEAARAWAAYDRDGAVRALDVVLAAAPGDPQPRFERGIHRLGQRRFDEAAADFRAVLQSTPSFAAARPHLARAFLRAGRIEEARAAAAEAVRELPDEPLPLLVECEVLRRAGERDAAVAACSRAIEKEPGNVSAYQGRAYVHREAGDFAAARKDFQAAFTIASVLPDAAYKDLMVDWAKAEDISFDVAMTHLLEGDWRKGILAARETAAFTQRVRPGNAVFYYDALGRIYLQDGKPREAARAYQEGHESIEKVAGLSEDEQTLWRGRWVHGIGRSHARAGRFREAHAQAALLVKMINEAGAKGDPYRPSLHYMRGYVLLEEGKYERALEELRQANQDDVYVQWLMARALRGRGDHAAAQVIVDNLRAAPRAGFGYALVRREVFAWRRRYPRVPAEVRDRVLHLDRGEHRPLYHSP